ncbi:MAG: methyltransferase type 11 [Gracilibacter sp. BRH_c7a]|nr:MAG: methyltransferase type 11 [Gracilibacter sp. BRH_c7a]
MSESFKSKEFAKPMIGDQEIGRWKKKAKQYIDNPSKVKDLLTKAISKAENNKQLAIFSNLWDKIHLLFSLIKDWLNGGYKDISKSAMLLIIAGLIYFVSPIDIIPDWIIGLGFADDIAFLAMIINQLDKELIKYKLWKTTDTDPENNAIE